MRDWRDREVLHTTVYKWRASLKRKKKEKEE